MFYKKIGAERIDSLFEYDVKITRSESTMIRVKALDEDDALDKAEKEVSDHPNDMDWESNKHYYYHVHLVEE